MRVLHVISSLAGGGAEVFVKDLSVALVEAKTKVAIAFVSSAKHQGNDEAFEQQFKNDLTSAGIEVFEIGHSCRKNPLLGAVRLRGIVDEFRPDVLHVHLGQGLLYRSLMLSRIPTLYTHHNIIFKFGKALTWLFDRNIRSYIAICKSCEQLLKQRTSRPVTLIRNGISQRRKAPSDPIRGSGQFNILSVGRISQQKNYRSIIGIARLCKQQFQLSNEDVRFRICGDGPDIDVLREEARSNGVDDIVHFLGARTDVPELMAASDVLLMTSIYEGMPITLIEAAHAGLPMIATDVGGCPEIVEHGTNGYLFRPDDNGAAAGFLHELLLDRGLRSSMSVKSLAAAEEFGMTHVMEQHLSIYFSVKNAA